MFKSLSKLTVLKDLLICLPKIRIIHAKLYIRPAENAKKQNLNIYIFVWIRISYSFSSRRQHRSNLTRNLNSSCPTLHDDSRNRLDSGFWRISLSVFSLVHGPSLQSFKSHMPVNIVQTHIECKPVKTYRVFLKQGGMPEFGGFWRDIWRIFGGHLEAFWRKIEGHL